MSENEQKEIKTRKKTICRILLVAMLLVQASLLAYLAWSTSPNRTEVGHLGAIVYFWNTGNFDVFHVNPPLTRFFAGVPIALFCKPKYDWTGYSSRPQDRCEWKLGNDFITANEFDDLRMYVFLMRLACIPFVLLGGFFGFRFASELYGKWSGFVFLILWTFSPLILGWGATICPDVAAASMGILGLYTFWHWLKNPTWGKATLAGICLGLMPLTKITWIIAFPTWLLLWGVWLFFKRSDELKPPLRQFAVVLLFGIYMLNMGYLFDGSFRQLRDYQFISGTLTGHEIVKGKTVEFGNRFADSWVGNVPVPFPVDFVQGIDTQKLDFERGIDSYARGVWSDHGWWWYYGYVLLLKEPLGIWCLFVLALLTSGLSKGFNASRRDELIVLLPMLLIFAFISSQDGFSIHPRYVILVLPLVYIWVSKLGQSFTREKSIFIAATIACVVWIVGGSLWFYPYSMSYFNELAGKPKNWPKHLLGSNIDWGQNAYTLKRWIENHPEARPLYVSYTSPIPLEKLGIEYDGEIPPEPTSGCMVVGVNELYGKEGKYDWLKREKSAKMIGYSVWVFHIR